MTRLPLYILALAALTLPALAQSTKPAATPAVTAANVWARQDLIDAQLADIRKLLAAPAKPKLAVYCDPFPPVDAGNPHPPQVYLARRGARPMTWVGNGPFNALSEKVGNKAWATSTDPAVWRKVGREAGRVSRDRGGVPMVLDVEHDTPSWVSPEWAGEADTRKAFDLLTAWLDGLRDADPAAECWLYWHPITYAPTDKPQPGAWWAKEQKRIADRVTAFVPGMYVRTELHATADGRVSAKWYDEATAKVDALRKLDPAKPINITICPLWQNWTGIPGPMDDKPLPLNDWRAMLAHLDRLGVSGVIVFTGLFDDAASVKPLLDIAIR